MEIVLPVCRQRPFRLLREYTLENTMGLAELVSTSGHALGHPLFVRGHITTLRTRITGNVADRQPADHSRHLSEK